MTLSLGMLTGIIERRPIFGGLVRYVSRHEMMYRQAPSVPFGWTTRMSWGTGGEFVLPLWLAPVLDLWLYRWRPLQWLLRLDWRMGWGLIDYEPGYVAATARPRGWRQLPRFE
jgi:hypothetical protein